MPFDLDMLVYLDLDFIARKYEELTGEDPNSKRTRAEGANASIKALFANAGVSVTESVAYGVTSRQMVLSIWEKLEGKYQSFERFENYKGTKVLWLNGRLTIAEWKKPASEEPGYEFYELHHDSERMAFLPQDSYFAAGFLKALGASSALKGNISIPVRCLARVLWHVEDARNYVACPYIIVEKAEPCDPPDLAHKASQGQ